MNVSSISHGEKSKNIRSCFSLSKVDILLLSCKLVQPFYRLQWHFESLELSKNLDSRILTSLKNRDISFLVLCNSGVLQYGRNTTFLKIKTSKFHERTLKIRFYNGVVLREIFWFQGRYKKVWWDSNSILWLLKTTLGKEMKTKRARKAHFRWWSVYFWLHFLLQFGQEKCNHFIFFYSLVKKSVTNRFSS